MKSTNFIFFMHKMLMRKCSVVSGISYLCTHNKKKLLNDFWIINNFIQARNMREEKKEKEKLYFFLLCTSCHYEIEHFFLLTQQVMFIYSCFIHKYCHNVHKVFTFFKMLRWKYSVLQNDVFFLFIIKHTIYLYAYIGTLIHSTLARLLSFTIYFQFYFFCLPFITAKALLYEVRNNVFNVGHEKERNLCVKLICEWWICEKVVNI